MADKNLSLQIKVNTDTGQLEVLGAKFNQVSKQAREAESSFGSLAGSAKSLLGALGVGFSVAGAVAFFKASVAAIEEENEALRRLQFTVEATGKSFAGSQKKVEDFADEVQRTTRFSDTEALTTLEKFVRVTGDVGQAMEASRLAMNLSTRSGKDLAFTQGLVTDLLNGQQRALIQVNKEFGAFTGGAKDAQGALEALQRNFNGTASEQETVTLKNARLKNSFGELMDAVGDFMSGPWGTFVDGLTKATNAVTRLVAAMGPSAALIEKTKNLTRDQRAEYVELGKEIEKLKLTAQNHHGFMTRAESDRMVALVNEQKAILEKANAAAAASGQEQGAEAERLRARVQGEQDAADKVAEIENQLDVKMAALGEKGLQTRLAVAAAEYKAEKDKIDKIVGAERAKDAALKKLGDLHVARVKVETDAERKIKIQTAYDVAATALEALATLNSMGELRTREDARRAKLLLALEKAIAIARLWSAEAGKGVLGISLAAAGTGLIVAQFAAQSQAIDRAQQASAQGAVDFTASTPLPGGGSLDQTFGGAAPGGGGGSTGGGFAGAPRAGGGGGGGQTFINVGGVVVNFNADHVDLAELPTLLRRIGDAARSGTVEGLRMSVSILNAAQKNSGMAV